MNKIKKNKIKKGQVFFGGVLEIKWYYDFENSEDFWKINNWNKIWFKMIDPETNEVEELKKSEVKKYFQDLNQPIPKPSKKEIKRLINQRRKI